MAVCGVKIAVRSEIGDVRLEIDVIAYLKNTDHELCFCSFALMLTNQPV